MRDPPLLNPAPPLPIPRPRPSHSPPRPAAYDRDTLPPPAPPPAPPPLSGSSGPGGPAPPPPPRRRTALDAPPTARTLLTTIALSLTAGGLWWAALFGHDPVNLGVSEDGFAFATTAAGNTVLVSRDDAGRFIFVDRAGDLFYEAGTAADGFYIVTPQNDIYNAFVDEDGQVKRVSVGRLEDIVTVQADAIGGIPVERLRQLTGDRDAGTLTALYTGARDEADPAAVLLPPNAPVELDADGVETGPVALEESMILLEQKTGLFGGKLEADPSDPLDRLVAVADRAAALKQGYDDAVAAGVVDDTVVGE